MSKLLVIGGGAAGMFNGTLSLPVDHIADTEVISRYIQRLGDTIRASQYAVPQQRIQFIE